jgi:hypothetical protein
MFLTNNRFFLKATAADARVCSGACVPVADRSALKYPPDHIQPPPWPTSDVTAGGFSQK